MMRGRRKLGFQTCISRTRRFSSKMLVIRTQEEGTNLREGRGKGQKAN
jgi:hypothetical protein